MSFRGGANPQILQDGALRGQRPGINFLGMLVSDDPANKRVNVDLGITGVINGDGTIARGTGFTAARTGAGIYTVAFVTPFAVVPLVVANAIITPAVTTQWWGATPMAITVNGFTLTTWGGVSSAAPAVQDGQFHFWAGIAS